MLYYIKTGGTSTCLQAMSHEEAARKAVQSSSSLGLCVIVSEKKITKKNVGHEVYFLTSNLLKSRMRVVG